MPPESNWNELSNAYQPHDMREGWNYNGEDAEASQPRIILLKLDAIYLECWMFDDLK